MAKEIQPAKPLPQKTRTLPEGLRGAEFDGPDIPTAIQVYDTEVIFDLPRDQRAFRAGSAPDNDLAIRDDYVSGSHCLIERRGQALRIHDLQTHNGTYFDGRRVEMFDARPGDTFVAGRVRLLILNDEMRAAFPILTDILGSPDAATLRASSPQSSSACDLIVAAKEGANILIMGESGCDQDRLAETIHGISLRRARDLVQLDAEPSERAEQRAVIDRANRSTLVLTINAKTPVMDATFVSMLFDPSYHIRIIVIGPSVQKVRDVFGEAYVSTMRQLSLTPLSQRPGAVPRLLDRMLAERDVALRFSDLTSENQEALVAHDWHIANAPKNMAALRLAADRFPTIATSPSLNQAAQKLGISSSTLQNWFANQIGLSWPLVTNGVER
jgi:Inner membrane component of T3SS, cytoplasmic domain